MFKFFKEVFAHFLASDTFQKGASLAYYAVFSLLPIIVIIISVLGLFFGKQAVSGEIYDQLEHSLGHDAANQIQGIIKNQHLNHNNWATAFIGFATLAFSASGMFSQIHNSLNAIWNIRSKPKSGLLKYLSKRLVSFTVLIVSFFLMFVSTLMSSFLVKHSASLHTDYRFLPLYENGLSFAVMGIVFAMMFIFLGDAKVHWRAAILGGLITSALFLLGKVGIAAYIGHSPISSTFGSASVLAVLLLWVYYTSQIIFLGASFVQLISKRLGHEILPNKNAVRIKKVEVPLKNSL